MIGTRARLLLATLTIVAGGVSAATTSGASIGPECFGDTNTNVCVTVDPSALPPVAPAGGPGIHDCIFVGPPPCVPVDLPTPSVSPGSGSLVTVQCTGLGSLCSGLNTGPNNLELAGTGGIAPGLSTTPTPQTFFFNGSGVGSVGSQTGQFSCSVTGNDAIGTVLNGAGSFSGSCNTPCGTVGVSGTYNRTGGTVAASGGLFSGCLGTPSFSGTCTFAPTGPPPAQSFAVLCEFSFP